MAESQDPRRVSKQVSKQASEQDSIQDSNHVAQPPELDHGWPGRPWKRWIGRGVLAVLLVGGVTLSWPMIKGVYYGYVPPASVGADQLPRWRESYQAALTDAASSGKPVLIDFSADWCPPCRVMEADVWPNQTVRDTISARVVPLQVDVDDAGSRAVIRRYPMRYIPTILIVDATGKELARGSFMSADQMVAFINAYAPAASKHDDASAAAS